MHSLGQIVSEHQRKLEAQQAGDWYAAEVDTSRLNHLFKIFWLTVLDGPLQSLQEYNLAFDVVLG